MPFPGDFKAVVSVACSEYGAHFFTEGGCGVLAALFAEAAVSNGREGEFRLIYRLDDEDIDDINEADEADESFILSHIVFFDRSSGKDFDVNGANAQDRWEESFNEVRFLNNESEAVFDDEGIEVNSQSDIYSLLKDITDANDLNADIEWVRHHYPDLRHKVFEALRENDSSFSLSA